MKLIELNMQRIIDLCLKHKVKTLAVFGSILTDRFNDQSDVDLLVNFDTTDHEKWDYVTNYFDFRDALERLFRQESRFGSRERFEKQVLHSQCQSYKTDDLWLMNIF